MLCISLVLLIYRYSAQILPAECSPPKSLILLEILPAEFIQAYPWNHKILKAPRRKQNTWQLENRIQNGFCDRQDF